MDGVRGVEVKINDQYRRGAGDTYMYIHSTRKTYTVGQCVWVRNEGSLAC